MKPGDMLETGVWLAGTETKADVARFKREAEAVLRDSAAQERMALGVIVWATKRPGDNRVPKVPRHIHGPDVRLLVAEALVLERAQLIVEQSFLLDLDPVDLQRLREITRRQHRRANPGALSLTDTQCDAVIEEVGPEAAMDVVRKAVDSKVLH